RRIRPAAARDTLCARAAPLAGDAAAPRSAPPLAARMDRLLRGLPARHARAGRAGPGTGAGRARRPDSDAVLRLATPAACRADGAHLRAQPGRRAIASRAR